MGTKLWYSHWCQDPSFLLYWIQHILWVHQYCGFIHSSIIFSSISINFHPYWQILSIFIYCSSNLPILYNVEEIVWPTVYTVFSVVHTKQMWLRNECDWEANTIQNGEELQFIPLWGDAMKDGTHGWMSQSKCEIPSTMAGISKQVASSSLRVPRVKHALILLSDTRRVVKEILALYTN
jgi:hypothetical protein